MVQVRNIVGALVRVGNGDLDESDIRSALLVSPVDFDHTLWAYPADKVAECA